MNFQTRSQRRVETMRIVAFYSLFGLAWIYGSDTLLGLLVHDPAVMVKLAVIKGSLFILCTATLLYFLINRFVRQLTAAEVGEVESLNNYEAIFNSTNEALLIHDAHTGRILDINDRVLDIYGYNRTEVLSAGIGPLSEGASPYSSVEAIAKIQSALTDGPQVFEWRSRRKSGELFWSEVSLRRVSTREQERVIAVVRDIDERKKLGDMLQASEERHRTILNSAMDGFWLVSRQGRLLEVNEAYCRMSGYTLLELLGMSISDLDADESAAEAVAHNEMIMAKGEDRFVSRHRRKDGSVFEVEVSAKYLPDTEGLFVGFLRDITDRKHAENALKESGELFRSFVENANDIVFSLSPEGIFNYVSPNWKDAFGYERSETIGMPFVPFVHPDDTAGCYTFLKKVMETGEKQSDVEYRVRHKNGTWIWYSANGSLLHDPESGAVSFLGIGRDISERLRAQRTLDERNSLLTSLLASLPVGVFMVEAPSGKPLIANDKALELLGRGILPDTSRENLTEVYEAYISGTSERYPVDQMPIIRGMYGETTSVDDLQVIRPDGTSKLLGITGTPVLDAAGRPWASLVCFQDITDRREHELEELKIQKLESLGILAGGIAHDFNNILTGIMGNISLAKMFIDDSHKSFNALVGAERAAVRASELARQLLTFARGGEPVKKVISLQHLVQEAVSLVLHGSNVKGSVDIPDSIHAIKADEGQISQVLHNIIINATQAMPGGGGLAITARNETLDGSSSTALPPGPYICMTLTDEGCGISEADLKKIFDPYFTTKVSGTGLGLATTRSIILKHCGHISVSSTVDKGTSFTIHLPSIGESISEYHTSAGTHTPRDHTGSSILVMDDDETIRDLSAEMLAEIGYRVTTCRDGKEAVELYRAAKESGTAFSAVVMDLTIPGGMGGREAAEMILADDPAAFLIVSSGYSNDPIMSDFGSYGFAGAIAKPYRVDELAEILGSVT